MMKLPVCLYELVRSNTFIFLHLTVAFIVHCYSSFFSVCLFLYAHPAMHLFHILASIAAIVNVAYFFFCIVQKLSKKYIECTDGKFNDCDYFLFSSMYADTCTVLFIIQ